MGMPQGNMPGQMQLPLVPNMPGGPGPNQMPGIMQNSALTASLQNQSQTNLGNLLLYSDNKYSFFNIHILYNSRFNGV